MVSASLGGWSVFASTNQAGSTALLLLGAVFLLMAMTGRVPDRIGREGIEHDSIEEKTVKDALEFGSPGTQREVAELLNSNAREVRRWTAPTETLVTPADSSRAQALARIISLEEAVASVIATTVAPPFTVERDVQVGKSPQLHGATVDIVINRGDALPIGVVVLAGPRTAKSGHVLKQLNEMVAEGSLAHAIIVVARAGTDPNRAWWVEPREITDGNITVVEFDDHQVGEVSSEAAVLISSAVEKALRSS
nr:hypothetical protein [Rhodococcus sp. JVH1]